MSVLSEAFELAPMGPNTWRGFADPRNEGGSGIFGGWTAAVLLKSVLDDGSHHGTPSAITVNYLKHVPARSTVVLRTRHLGDGGHSLNFWQAEMFLEGQTEPAAIATIILANRRKTDAFTDVAMPLVPSHDTIEPIHLDVALGQHFQIKPVIGNPPFDRPDTKSITWVRETSGRALDYLQLTFLSDAYAPRIFYKSKGPRQTSTITLSVYFHAPEVEIASIGDAFILNEACGTRADSCTIGQQARLWSQSGALLATTEQLCWFH
jgi:acyl-CoA thioesterase